MEVSYRKAFTLIELIFVILVTAILAAVALPKFESMAKNAKRTNVMAFVGTLNRTVGSSMWKEALLTDDGKVASGGANLCTNITNYINLPDEVTDFSADCRLTIDVALGAPAVNSFNDGTTVESPRWKLSF